MTVDAGTRNGPAPGRARTRRRTGRWVLLVLLVLLAAGLAGAVLLVRDALAAREALAAVAVQVPTVEQELRDAASPGGGDSSDGADRAQVEAALAELVRATDDARAATDGPLWWLAARAPVVGPSARAVADVALVLDDVADRALPGLVQVADAVAATGRTPDGGLDLGPLRAAAPAATEARATVDAARSRLDGVDRDALLPELAGPVRTLHDRLGDLAGVAAGAERAAVLAPAMLGADGPRTYLVLGMNSAELRAGGGIPGALLLLRVDEGRVELVRQVPASAVGPFDEPVLPLAPDDVAAYTPRLGRFVQDVTATPHFPTSARLAAAMWARAQGEEVDGVLATDPVALATLLTETGPVDVPLSGRVADALGRRHVEVGGADAVDVLLRRAYDLLEPDDADLFFADVAGAVLARATAPDVAPGALLGGLRTAAGEHRLRVWSAHDAEQRRLAGTVLAGGFDDGPRSADAVGVLLTDHVSGKMSAYLDVSLTHARSRCTPEGRVDVLELRLASTAPADAATALPWYVAGLPGGEVPPGTLLVGVTVAGPRGGPAPRLERDGDPFGGRSATTHGRPTTAVTVRLDPGASTTLRLRVPAAAEPGPATPPGRLEVWSTPTVSAGGLLDVPVPRCG